MTWLGDCQKSALSPPVAPPRQTVFAPPGTPSPGSSLAPSNPAPPETIPFTVEAITFVSQGITYRTERTTLVAKRISTTQTSPPPEPPEPNQESLSLAARVFQLLSALDPDNRLRKAPPIKVFLLRFGQNHSLSQIARICDCGKSLVALRLQAIKEKLPWQPKQLREMSAQVEAMQDALADPRARSIYRMGSVYGDDGPDSD